MPWLHFSDNTKRHASYNEAAELKQVLEGLKPPKDDAQADLCLLIRAIEFDVTPKLSTRNTHPNKESIKQVMNSSLLYGKARFDAMREAFRGN